MRSVVTFVMTAIRLFATLVGYGVISLYLLGLTEHGTFLLYFSRS